MLVYSLAACLLRGADAAAIIGIVLAARGVGTGDVTGVLAACITLPHLAGPIAAQLLDRARRKKLVLAGAGVVYAVALGGAVLLLPISVVAAAGGLLVAGFAGPLLTGGLSSQLAAIVGPTERTRRRAQGVDAFTYGVAATVGPAVVAVIASTSTPTTAVLIAAVAAGVGAIVVLLLPNVEPDTSRSAPTAVRLRAALGMLVRLPGLRRTTIATAVTAVPLGAVPLLAVATVDSLGAAEASSAVLTSAYGAGNLVVSAVLIAVPLRGTADRLVRFGVVVVAVGFALGLLVSSVPVGAVVFALLGVATGVLFTASLAARAAFSPAGAEAQVFVSMAGIKVASSSVGTAVAGALIPLGGAVMFAIAATLTLLTLLTVIVDRRPQTTR
ncbi:MFS transporter [Curtobacterium sp. 9128]|uniref:MFS transporter n=1 Tax=Curtobacterium sp. 9128 TaxID=1793722 RepID=UPI001642F4DC|nr:MFS transporter [Curtobacterium sp. 9128]